MKKQKFIWVLVCNPKSKSRLIIIMVYHVTCHMSCDIYYNWFSLHYWVQLVNGGSVINGATQTNAMGLNRIILAIYLNKINYHLLHKDNGRPYNCHPY